jgi:flagellar motor switch protein FliG
METENDKHNSIKAESGRERFKKINREQGYKKAAELLLLLDKDAFAKVFSRLDEEEVIGIVKEARDVLSKIDSDISQGHYSTQHIDGKSALRNILQNMDVGQENMILESLAGTDPELALELGKELFNMKILYNIPHSELQFFFRGFSDRALALILKGEGETLKEYILHCVSERRKNLILEELDLIGEIPKEEIEKAKNSFLKILKTNIENGEMTVQEKDE